MEVRMNGYTPNDSLLRHWNVLWNELEPARKSAPAADVVEDADGYHFYFEMAGINSASVDVRVEDGNLVVEAERKRPEWSKDAEVHLSERAYGTMRRAFTMPEDASQREYQGGIQGRSAERDGAEAAREQAVQDQGRVRELGEFWLRRRQ